jgi:hypothetical protein
MVLLPEGPQTHLRWSVSGGVWVCLCGGLNIPPRPRPAWGGEVKAGQGHGGGVDGVCGGPSVGTTRGFGARLAVVITTTHASVIV